MRGLGNYSTIYRAFLLEMDGKWRVSSRTDLHFQPSRFDMVRGPGKYKVKRGGGRQFTSERNMTLDGDGVAVAKWLADRFDWKRFASRS